MLQSRAAPAFAATLSRSAVAPALRAVRRRRHERDPSSLTGYTQFNTNLDQRRTLQLGGGHRQRVGHAASSRRELSAGARRRATSTSRGISAIRSRSASRAVEEPERAERSASDFTYAYAPDLFIVVDADRRMGPTNPAPTPATRSPMAPSRRSRRSSRPISLLGLGVSAFRRVDKTQALPFLDRQLEDQRQVAHRRIRSRPDPPAAPGSKLVYAPDDRWEFAEGVTYRSYRFRLATGQPDAERHRREQLHSALPARHAQAHEGRARSISTARSSTGGKLTVDTENGGGRYSDNYKIGPALGATLVVNF